MSGNNCSYCNNPYHNIRNCVNPHIRILYQEMYDMYRHWVIEDGHDENIDSEIFINLLYRRFNLSDLRVIGVKFAGALSKSSKMTLAKHIQQHLKVKFNVNNTESVITSESVRTPDNNIVSLPVLSPVPIRLPNINWLVSRNDRYGNYNIYTIEIPEIPETTISPFVIRNLLQDFDNKHNIHLNKCDNLNIKETDCSICYEKLEMKNTVQLNCEHQFCMNCICGYFKNNMLSPTCALCREPIININTTNKEVLECLLVLPHSSTNNKLAFIHHYC